MVPANDPYRLDRPCSSGFGHSLVHTRSSGGSNQIEPPAWATRRAQQAPPALADGLLDGPRLPDPNETSRALTVPLRKKFPQERRRTHYDWHSQAKDSPPTDCVRRDEPGPDRLFTPCPTYDQSKSLRYRCVGSVCGHTIAVRWLKNARNG